MIKTVQLGSILFAAIFGIAGVGVGPFVCAAADPAAPPPGNAVSVPLEYQETTFPVSSSFVTPDGQRGAAGSAIKKLPDAKGRPLVSGFLPLGNDRMAFAWDRSRGKLYLDLNHNLDLTDDPDGVFSSPTSSQNVQFFQNIRLSATNNAGDYRVLVDLQFYGSGSSPNVYANVRSFYSGQFELSGKTWQAGVIEKPFDYLGRWSEELLLRRWEERTEPFNTGSIQQTLPLAGQTIFFQNEAWKATVSTEKPGRPLNFNLDLIPQACQLGELNFSGESVKRLVLEDAEKLTATFENPAGTLKLPAGTYTHARVWLKNGGGEAFSDYWVHLAINPKEAVKFSAGGPLTNTVAVTRHGQLLQLDYRLIGMSGQSYQFVQQDRSKPPEFAIYKGDRKLATGKFEFG